CQAYPGGRTAGIAGTARGSIRVHAGSDHSEPPQVGQARGTAPSARGRMRGVSDFCNKIGTKRTCRDGLLVVRFRGEADIREQLGSATWAAIDPERTNTAQSSRAQSPKLLARAANAVPASMAPTALRVATITIAAVPTPSQMRGPADQVVAATIEISTDTDMYLRNASMRGVIVAYDMI